MNSMYLFFNQEIHSISVILGFMVGVHVQTDVNEGKEGHHILI